MYYRIIYRLYLKHLYVVHMHCYLLQECGAREKGYQRDEIIM